MNEIFLEILIGLLTILLAIFSIVVGLHERRRKIESKQEIRMLEDKLNQNIGEKNQLKKDKENLENEVRSLLVKLATDNYQSSGDNKIS
jgi:cell division protein FtsL